MCQDNPITNSIRNIVISSNGGNCTDSNLIYATLCTEHDLINKVGFPMKRLKDLIAMDTMPDATMLQELSILSRMTAASTNTLKYIILEKNKK